MKNLIRKMILWAFKDNLNNTINEQKFIVGLHGNANKAVLGLQHKSFNHNQLEFNDESSPFKFSLFPASGGLIVSVERYDINRDTLTFKHYIISDMDKVGEELANILVMERLHS